MNHIDYFDLDDCFVAMDLVGAKACLLHWNVKWEEE